MKRLSIIRDTRAQQRSHKPWRRPIYSESRGTARRATLSWDRVKCCTAVRI